SDLCRHGAPGGGAGVVPAGGPVRQRLLQRDPGSDLHRGTGRRRARPVPGGSLPGGRHPGGRERLA
ncbi:hypothetical protein LLOABG_LLOABG_06570, partial [Dysosmobacter welbionis]